MDVSYKEGCDGNGQWWQNLSASARSRSPVWINKRYPVTWAALCFDSLTQASRYNFIIDMKLITEYKTLSGEAIV